MAAHRWTRSGEQNVHSQIQVAGQTILDLRAGDFQASRTQNEAKQLFQAMLAQYVLDRPLLTRQVARELRALADVPVKTQRGGEA